MECSVEELENSFWGDPEYNSHLVVSCHRLRKVPLKNLDAENLRMLIGQKIGLKYLVPLAIDFLEKDPFCSGDFYNGALLAVVLSIENDYWYESEENRDIFFRVSEIMTKLETDYEIYLDLILPKWKKLEDSNK